MTLSVDDTVWSPRILELAAIAAEPGCARQQKRHVPEQEEREQDFRNGFAI